MANQNPYLDLLQQDTETDLRQSMVSAADKQPDVEARLRKLASDYQLPVEAVRLDRETVERKAKLDSVDYLKLAKELPATAAVFKDPNNAAIVYDDLENLTGIEKALKFGKNTGSAALSGVFGATEGVAGLMEGGADALARVTGPVADAMGVPDVLGRPLAQDIRDIRQNQRDWRQYLTPKGDSNLESGYYSGVQSLSQNLLTLPLAIATDNPSLMLNALTGITGGQSYGKARDKGLSLEQSALYGAADATVEKATEMLPVGQLFKDLKAGSGLFKTLSAQLATEIPGEQVATAFQDLNEWAVLHPEKTFQDYLADRPDAAIQTLIATAVGTGGVVGTMKAAEALANGQLGKARQSQNRTAQLEELHNLAAASKVMQRDPALVKAVAEGALADSDAQNVFIDANTLAQSGVLEQLVASMPELEAQLPDALATGGEVKIPLADYVTNIAPASYAQSLLPHVRLEGEDFTPAQAKAYIDNHQTELQALQESHVLDLQQQQAKQASILNVKALIKDKLDSISHHTGAVNDHNATLHAHFYAAMGEKLGMSAESLYEQYPVEINSTLLGRVLGQKAWHGSPYFFDKFSLNNVSPDYNKQKFGYGLYFSDSKSVAEFYKDYGKTETSINGTLYHVELLPSEDDYLLWDKNLSEQSTKVLNALQNAKNGFLAEFKEPIENLSVQSLYFAASDFYGSDKSASEHFLSLGIRGIKYKFADDFNYVIFNDNDVEIKAFYQDKRGASKALYQSAFDQPLTTQTPLPERQTTITVDGVERSTLNSNGQAIHPTVEGVENFWRWFGDSKVVDESGRPLVVYHGTKADFKDNVFKLGEIAHGRASGDGFYFTSKKEIANAHGKDGHVMPVYLKSNDPFYGNPFKLEEPRKSQVLNGEGDFNEVLKSVGFDSITDEKFDVIVVFDPTQIKSATGNTGEFNPENPNILYQFAGENAETANQFTLETAQQRLASGEDAETIRQDTGWFKGVDDKWRFEISDKDASIANGLAYKGNPVGPAASELIRKLDRPLVLSDVLQHPALFAAYPDLANFGVTFVPGKTLNNARGSISGKQILLDDQLPGIDVKSVLLHEIQHGIQTIEGFASGGNPEQFKNIKALHGELLRQKNQVLDDYGFDYWANDLIINNPEKYNNLLLDGKDSLSLEPMYKEFVKTLAEDDARYFLYKLNDYDKQISKYEKLSRYDKDEAYFRLAGETEARNTQARASMTDAERLARSPESTQDVKNSDVIVLFNGTEMHNAPMPANTLNQTQRGAFNPDTRTITLLDNADLSTFLHETGHLFLELQFDLVSRLMQENHLVGSTDMQKQLIKDTQTLLGWFGLDGETGFDQWHALDFEQKRAYHEKFAVAFEKYLMEGKAPSLELARVFASFRQWLKDVYKYVVKYFDGVELTDEVRGVFDRMLATDEQIALAQQGRSLLPLFADQAKSGMSETEFAEYQATWAASTSDAQEQLAIKGLKDMQWLQNARSKTLKQLQAKHDSLRRAIRSEVRLDVYERPVYRAWQYLTGKLRDEDKIQPVKKSSNPNVVDATQDNLFVAIAKLGGLDKQEVVDRWDWDQQGRAPMPVFSKPVVRKTGGLSIEAMAEKLVDEGYLSTDEHGKFDTREFEEKFGAQLRGQDQFSHQFDDRAALGEQRAGEQIKNIYGLHYARIEAVALDNMLDLPDRIINRIKELKMTAKEGLHPDIVADLFGFSSGDELMIALAEATPPNELIEQLTDQRMLQEHGELSTPEAIQREADRAISNDARAKMVSTEATFLAKATGSVRLLTAAAKEMAFNMISRVKIRDLSPSLYSRAEAKAAKAALQAEKAGDMATAAAEKRNQLINIQANKAAHEARESIEKGVKYLKKFENGGLPTIDADYNDQIMAILDRYDFKKLTDAERNRRQLSLENWLKQQEDEGLTPNIHAALLKEHQRIPYKDLTVEELRGVIDAVKQIEHMGREKYKMRVLSEKRNFLELQQEVSDSIFENAKGRTRKTEREAQDLFGKFKQSLNSGFYHHIRAYAAAKVLDGGDAGGKVWEYFIKPANERGEWETSKRAEYTSKLSEILKPVFDGAPLGGSGQYYPSIGTSLNKTQVMGMALNMGNASNLQRLMGGEGWTLAQINSVVKTLTAEDWRAVQQIWNLIEEFKPLVAAKERRLYGKEPAWIEPQGFTAYSSDAGPIEMAGGYYPVKYDPRGSLQAEQHADAESAKDQLKAAYSAATTRRSFTKNRVDEVLGRPLLLSLDGVFSGINEVIHDLAWHEWLIDMNKVLASKLIVDGAIRPYYGSDIIRVFKDWRDNIAGGDEKAKRGIESAMAWMRQNVSASGLSFNVMSGAMQFTGLAQSMLEVGSPWVFKGIMTMLNDETMTRDFVNERSPLMQNRSLTRFRELAELRNRIQYQSEAKANFDSYKFWIIVRAQGLVDYPTWVGAYLKALNDYHGEEKAAAMADQAVINSQGGGETKDLSAIENNKNPWARLFSLYYNFMGTKLNMAYVAAQTTQNKAELAAKMLLLFTVPLVMEHALRAALTPDDDDWDEIKWQKHLKELAGEQSDQFLGLFVGLREIKEPIKHAMQLSDQVRNYEGPTGLRLFGDLGDLTIQAGQGEFDAAFRKAFINVIGDTTGLPSAQINKTWTGAEALADDDTDNPAALLFGYKK
jgi:hypothetical protein